jgi:hypothetical protein
VSVKLFEGHIAKEGIGITDLVLYIQTGARKILTRRLKELYLAISETSATSEGLEKLRRLAGEDADHRLLKYAFSHEKLWTPITSYDYVHDLFKLQSIRYDRNQWNLEVSVSAYEVENRWLVLPHEDNFSLLAGLRSIFGLSEKRPVLETLFRRSKIVRPYGYWNSVDPDPKVSDDEWQERERRWLSIADDPNASDRRILIEVLAPSSDVLHRSALDMKKEWADLKAKIGANPSS